MNPMLLQFFGLRDQPFAVTPDPRYLYESATHREALASLRHGLISDRGFLALVGRPGLGKTTLLFRLLEQYRQSAATAFLFQTQCNSREFLSYLVEDLGIECKDPNNVVAIHRRFNEVLVEQARAGRRCIIVIDEAQNLDNEVLETVRLLSDFETSRTKLLQIILAGQPALDERLRDPSLDQLRQRISIICRLTPLPVHEVDGYISFRLKTAGYTGTGLFTSDARTRIAELSEGIPRVISNICFNALSLAFATQQREITPELIDEVGSDLGLAARSSVRQVVAGEHSAGSIRQSSLSQQTRSDAAAGAAVRSRPAAVVHTPALKPQPSFMQPLGVAAVPARTSIRLPQGRGQRTPQKAVAPNSSRPTQLIEKAAVVLATGAVCLSVAMLAFTHRTQHSARVAPAERPSQRVAQPAATPQTPTAIGTTPVRTPAEIRANPNNTGHQKGSDSSRTGNTQPAAMVHHPGPAPRTAQPDVRAPEVLRISGAPATNLRAHLPEAVPRTAVPSFSASNAAPANLPGYVTKMVKPDYPEAARAAAIQGVVTLQALVGTDGTVKQVQVVDGVPQLTEAAMRAVRHWQYRPYLENGVARMFQTVVRIRFILDESSEDP